MKKLPKQTSFPAAALLAAALAAAAAAPHAAHAQMKYVAVVEVELDASSGAAEDLSAAEVRQITAELRREAVENLPVGKYNIMTAETVQSMGGAVLEECAEENCVVALGSKIGAEYIVRGIISKFKTNLTLSVEIYETEDGMLVASSDPIRSENAEELLQNSSTVCAAMYKKFVETRNTVEIRKQQKQQKQPLKAFTPAPAPLERKVNIPFWGGLAADVAGAGMLVYGAYQEGNVKSSVNKYAPNGYYTDETEQKNAQKLATNRNIGYIIGSAFLLTGISVHIFF